MVIKGCILKGYERCVRVEQWRKGEQTIRLINLEQSRTTCFDFLSCFFSSWYLQHIRGGHQQPF